MWSITLHETLNRDYDIVMLHLQIFIKFNIRLFNKKPETILQI